MIFTAELSNSTGSPGGMTSSPGDNNLNCTQCHGGTALAQSGWISTNIPANGYIPGQTYTISTTLTHAGAGRYGFELTAENNAAMKVGTFALTNTTETKLTNAGKAVTHAFAGTTGAGGAKTWSFSWQAPAAGTGNVTFFAAYNAANGNGTTSGDVIYTSSLLVQEDIATGMPKISASTTFNVYPNPASDKLYVARSESMQGLTFRISDISGRIWVTNALLGTKNEIEVRHLPKGIYFLTVGDSESRRVVIL